jgi:hypothetical protein
MKMKMRLVELMNIRKKTHMMMLISLILRKLPMAQMMDKMIWLETSSTSLKIYIDH